MILGSTVNIHRILSDFLASSELRRALVPDKKTEQKRTDDEVAVGNPRIQALCIDWLFRCLPLSCGLYEEDPKNKCQHEFRNIIIKPGRGQEV